MLKISVALEAAIPPDLLITSPCFVLQSISTAMERWKARVTLLLWQRGTFSSEVLCQAAQWAIFSLPSLVCDWAQTHQQLNKRLKNGRVCCVHVWGNRNSKIIVPCNINHAPGLGGSSRGSLGSCSTADRYHRFRASSPSSGLFQTHLQLQPWAGASAEPSLRLRARAALTHMTREKISWATWIHQTYLFDDSLLLHSQYYFSIRTSISSPGLDNSYSMSTSSICSYILKMSSQGMTDTFCWMIFKFLT